MKKLLLLSLIVLLAACGNNNDNNEPKEPFELDPNATILLRPDMKAFAKAPEKMQRAKITGLTPTEIVEQGINIKWQCHYFGDRYYDDVKIIGRGFSDAQRDMTIPALKMWATDILYKEQEDSPITIMKDFLYGFNVYLTDINNDTIGVVPDSVLTKAKEQIETAFEVENYDEIYRIFNEAFTFQPIK